MPLVSYLFWPNPEATTYDNPKVMVLLGICAVLVLLSIALRRWRQRSDNPITRRLSRNWASAAMWFGVVGLILAIARVEQISYISMRFWWAVWLLVLILVSVAQGKRWRSLHYQVLPKEKVNDPREKYLPKRKK
ncbi:MAG: hypothetical protein Greene101449_967 [Candidatus Peregrinibacteria bacterium Greene1014_49]|nr:MAG: hypothetical protein Greene101449_967 [Candidatus Peregrinibacteria bacterium Greene1014_49]